MHRTALRRGFHLAPGPLAHQLTTDAARAVEGAAGLFRRDPSTWRLGAKAERVIANRLGWLTAPALMVDAVERLKKTAADVRHAGFEDVVLLGMGGSSLAPEVLRSVIGVERGAPRFHMLDSTDPAAVRAAATTPARTLYILASKSGSTIEPNALAAHFKQTLQDAHVPQWSQHFIAITDEGTDLDQRARTERFREVYVNPSDIGGRYSVLSYFGLLPAALMGQDVGAILRWALALFDEAQAEHAEVTSNPAVALGLLMAAGYHAGRDKLTLVVPPALEPFGLWVEQLVAESTGKNDKGIVPIAGETFGEPSTYGNDRVFVRLRAVDDPDEERRDAAMRALPHAPVATIDFTEPNALGAEFARWEVATAIAGVLMGINPFDEPNVKEAKEATIALLSSYQADGRLPIASPDLTTAHGATLRLSAAAKDGLHGKAADAFLDLLAPKDYLAILAYLGPDPALHDALHHFRMAVRDRTNVATMLGFGPRYLHSTGQLHKGGDKNGVFVMVTATPAADVPIPGEAYSFGTLEFAQALGDFKSLAGKHRRALHVHLPSPDARELERVLMPLVEKLAHHPR